MLSTKLHHHHHHHNNNIAKQHSPFQSPNYLKRPLSISQRHSDYEDEETESLKHLYVLPVLLFEFLALAITRAVLPSKLLQRFGSNVYVVMGICEFVRGLLAFVACPMFGRVSDVLGRKPCLFVTVLGTCAPVCSLALFGDFSGEQSNNDNVMLLFVVLLALSGCFSATFTLTFAYISDCVPKGEGRIAAYGLALATFGLSFTIGPMAGGYLARSVEDISPEYDDSAGVAMATEISLNNESTEHASGGSYHATTRNHHTRQSQFDPDSSLDPRGEQRVFLFSFILVMITLLYITYFLPETVSLKSNDRESHEVSRQSNKHRIQRRIRAIRDEVAPDSWHPLDFLRIFSGDPFLAKIGQIVLLYYTGVYAVVSTMTLYAVKRFRFGPERLGELMSALGLCTMVAEVVLVRLVIPNLGEKRSLRVGLIAFALQCAVLCFAFEGWHLFICVGLSMVANLSYPAVTSMVSNAVAKDGIGEALGAMNGIKALTEGIGPLVFGGLMTLSEKSSVPGWPYMLAAIFAVFAYKVSDSLPDECGDDDRYISEKYANFSVTSESDRSLKLFMGLLGSLAGESQKPITLKYEDNGQEDEVSGLLSEIDTNTHDDKDGCEADERLMLDPHVYNMGIKTPVNEESLMYHI